MENREQIKSFIKKVMQIKPKNYPKIMLIAAVMSAISFLVSFVQISSINYEPFDPTREGYSEIEISYVMGPFARERDDSDAENWFFVAVTPDGYRFVLSSNESYCDYPTYSEEVSEDVLKSLSPTVIKGKNKEISDALKEFLVEYTSETGVTESNCDDIFGYYYLDTYASKQVGLIALLLGANFAAIIFAYGLLSLINFLFFINELHKLERAGTLEKIAYDYSCGKFIFNEKIFFGISNNYILSFDSFGRQLIVSPIEGIVNVYAGNQTNERKSTSKYVILEYANGKKKHILPHSYWKRDAHIADIAVNEIASHITTRIDS